MPTYEYHCTACGHDFEAFHSIKADPIKKCPACGKLKVERKIGIGGAVLFKGGGFYETDYRSESYTKAAEADRKASDGGGDKKSDSSAAPSAAAGGTTSANAGASASGDGKATTPASTSAPAAAASTSPPKDPPSKATHPSRVGRGAGNIIQKPPQPRSSAPAAGKPRKKR